jgi:CRISPR/Cas system-associated exonuclease Cas4 (RecB family)
LEEPDRVIDITPLQRGTLVHLILERAFTRFASEDLLPFEANKREAVIGLLDEETDTVLSLYRSRERVGLPFLWEMRKRDIADSVKACVENEIDEHDDLVPSMFEKSFGFDGKEVSMEIEHIGKEVSFRGRIDRIDLGTGGGFRVIDYKTGRIDFKDNDLGGGENLQLPVYLLAASSLLEREIGAGKAEYRRISLFRGVKRRIFEGGELEKRMEEFKEILETIIGGIENGLFFANPSKIQCKNCGFSSICPAYGEALFAAKSAADPRAERYLVMKGKGGTADG